MAQLFDIKKATIGPRNFEALVEVAPSAPAMTSDDPEGTDRVLDLLPGLVDHVCLGDSAPSFGEVVEDTELAHLLEHVTVELLARTDVAGDVTSGQTVGAGERAYKIIFLCPDDVLVAGALSSAVWILQWAYSGGGEPEPDIDAIVAGLVNLVESLSGEPEGDEEPEAEVEAVEADTADEAAEEEAAEPIADDESVSEDEPADDVDDAPEAEEPAEERDDDAPEAEAAEKDDPASDEWDMGDIPQPRFVR